MLILKFLHFCHSTDTNNRLYKIDELHDLHTYIDGVLKRYKFSSWDIFIDEILLLWKGRHLEDVCFLSNKQDLGYNVLCSVNQKQVMYMIL